VVKQVTCSTVGSQRSDLIGWPLSVVIMVYFAHTLTPSGTLNTVTAGSAVERRQL